MTSVLMTAKTLHRMIKMNILALPTTLTIPLLLTKNLETMTVRVQALRVMRIIFRKLTQTTLRSLSK